MKSLGAEAGFLARRCDTTWRQTKRELEARASSGVRGHAPPENFENQIV